METNIVDRGNEIKQKLAIDFEKNFILLLDFVVATGGMTPDVILLATKVLSIIENRHEGKSSIDMSSFKEESIAIVDKVMSRSGAEIEVVKNEPSREEIRNYYIAQRPKMKTVFIGKGIGKKYRSFSIKDIDIEIRLGEITGVVGENGNGKSTLLKIIAGELERSTGIMSYPLLGGNIGRFGAVVDWKKIKPAIGYVPQNITPWLNSTTVETQLKLTAAMKGLKGIENENAVAHFINRLGLAKYKNNKWSQLSGGYQLRFELARQLVWHPKLLILDEPLANLDIKAQTVLLNDIDSIANAPANPMAVIISSQNLYEIERVSDKIIFMKEGEIKYNDYRENIGRDINYNCYEIGYSGSEENTSNRIAAIDGVETVRSVGYYTLVYTRKTLLQEQLIRGVYDKGIELNYFRNITHSTRLLFEYDEETE